MRKGIKKIIVGAFIGLLSLQTVLALPASAQNTIYAGLTIKDLDLTAEVKVSKNLMNPDAFYALKLCGLYNQGWDEYGYNLTSYAVNKSDVIGTQKWNFKISMDDKNYGTLTKIALYDNLGTALKSFAFNKTITRGCSATVSVTTNLVNYDLDYDGQVTLADANFALRVARNIDEASDLQVLIADSNNNSVIDNTDVQTILNTALNIQ